MNPLASLLMLGDVPLGIAANRLTVVQGDPEASLLPADLRIGAPRPLVNRCACGRQISNNRGSCLKCAHEHLLQLAGEIHSPEAMVRVLELVPKDQRKEVFEKLAQHIDIASLVSESVAASDAAPVDSDVAPSPVNGENR